MRIEEIKKAIVLVGKGPVGKSRIAGLFCEGRKSVTLNGKSFRMSDLFVFSGCDRDTEIIHIDDLNLKKTDLEDFFDIIIKGITVNKKLHAPFVIFPRIIISIDCEMSDIPDGASYKGRFDVFEIKKCN